MDRKSEDADKALFREAVRDVRPLSAQERAITRRQRTKPRARFTRADRQAVLVESLNVPYPEIGTETGEELLFRRPGVQDSVMRKLRRGQYRVEAEIDLHGMIAAEAKAALREFLAVALSRGLRCVRIVHGKGLRSGPRGPVLKSTVNGLLRRADPVLAFCSARQVDGGTGAIYVLLSRAG